MAVTNRELMMVFRLENNIGEDVELYTFSEWKKRGYMVKKGEHAKYHTTLWKHKTKSSKEDSEVVQGYCFMKKTHLFTREQVEPMNK